MSRLGLGFIRQTDRPLPFSVHIRRRRGINSSFEGTMVNRCNLHSSSKDDSFVDIESTLGGSKSKGKTMELWLDLRGTALFPKAAMAYLSENIDGIIPGAIDRVIMSAETMEKLILQQGNQESREDNQGVNNADASFLCVPSRTNDLVVSCATTQQSMPCGKVIRSQERVLFDPLMALDIVMANGGWILMEQAPETEEKVWLEEVTSLMTFLMASSSSSTGVLGLNDLGSLSENSESKLTYDTPAGNGIAIACETSSLLMEVSKVFLTQTSLPAGTSTSPGGIILPASSGSVEDITGDDLKLAEIVEQVDDDQLPIAVVLPFDIKLWTMALELMADYDSGENESRDTDLDLR